MNPHDEKQLEQFIHRTLRSLPERRAPRTLEQRVFAALEARGALPWWRKSYANWPAPMRLAFLFVSALAATLIVGAMLFGHTETLRLTAGLAQQFAWVTTLRSIAKDIGGAFVTALGALPALWLYTALAAIAVGYVSLLGMGAAAYRVFFARR